MLSLFFSQLITTNAITSVVSGSRQLDLGLCVYSVVAEDVHAVCGSNEPEVERVREAWSCLNGVGMVWEWERADIQ